MTAQTGENAYTGRIVLATVRRFAGADVDRAKYYPEDAKYLLEMDPRVTHFELVAAPRLAGRGDDAGDVASLVAP